MAKYGVGAALMVSTLTRISWVSDRLILNFFSGGGRQMSLVEGTKPGGGRRGGLYNEVTCLEGEARAGGPVE